MDAEIDALAVAAEVVGVPVEAVEVEVAADLAVFSDPVLAVVVDLSLRVDQLSAARAGALRSRAGRTGRGRCCANIGNAETLEFVVVDL